MGDFYSRIGKASNPNENIGRYGEVTRNKNEAEMRMFRKNNEMKTLNDNVKKPGPEWTRQCTQKEEISIHFMVVKNESSIETEAHECAADVGTTDHCLIWTVTSLELSKIGAAGNCSDGEQIKLEMTERKTARVPTRDGQNDVQFSELSKSIGTTNDDMERDNAGRSEEYGRTGEIGEDLSK